MIFLQELAVYENELEFLVLNQNETFQTAAAGSFG